MCATPSADAAALIAALQLQPLPGEGGWFRQTWRNASGSAILYLMTTDQFSALHRLAGDEIWHFHAGDPVEHLQLHPRDGEARVTQLGADVLTGYAPQVVVPAGVWQGARIDVGQVSELTTTSERGGRAEGQVKDLTYFGWSLLGCTMAPPWDECGFELGSREVLSRAFPAHADLVRALTR